MYKLCPSHPVFGQSNSIIRIADGASIPANTDNTDYQAYLKWVDESPDNKPLPADE